jgi:hypothetical protein
MPNTTLQTVYTDLPLAALKHFALGDLPLTRKEKFIAEMQDRLDEVIRNIILKSFSQDSTLNEIENVLLTDSEISEEELLQKIIESNPEIGKKLSDAIAELYSNLTK